MVFSVETLHTPIPFDAEVVALICIDDMSVIIGASSDQDFENLVVFLPPLAATMP
ncbi:MAG: hypothetical protein OHK0046_30850 [Anaerolineae bacterium]